MHEHGEARQKDDALQRRDWIRIELALIGRKVLGGKTARNGIRLCVDLSATPFYIQGSGQFQIAGQTVLLRQVTRYPWEGQVKLSLEITQPASFSLLLRKPGWCGSMQIAINGEAVDWRAHWESGYVRLERVWQPSDQVQIEFDMPVERIYANPNVRQDLGYIALQRGPLVYRLEQADTSAPLHHIILPSTSPFSTHF